TGLRPWNDGQFTAARTGSGKRDGMLGGDHPQSLFQDHRGRIWVSTEHGVGYLERERFQPAVRISGRGSVVHAIAEDTSGNIWIADQNHALFRVAVDGTIQEIPWRSLGRRDFGFELLADRVKGGLWIGFLESGLAHVVDGQVRASYTAADGLAE